MIQDTINSIRLTLSDRIGNPFISATLIACVFLNWKLSLLLVSDVPYDNKVMKIIELYPDSSTRLESFLLYPIYFGLFWTFLWPVISMAINAYWYWMKSNIANVRLWAERKKKLSDAEAAELYSTIDSQESKYLEFLKDRQNRIDSLSSQLSTMSRERVDMEEKQKSEIEKLKGELVETRSELTVKTETSEKLQREKDAQWQILDEISNRSVEFAENLPGLKAITNAINQSTNHQANDAWLREEFKRQEPSFSNEEMQMCFDFFLALGLIKKGTDGHITFGDRYRNVRKRVLGMYNNSPGPMKPA